VCGPFPASVTCSPSGAGEPGQIFLDQDARFP
jgi:hypothetical protein